MALQRRKLILLKKMTNQHNQNIQKIEKFFKVPERVSAKVKNIAEKVKGGYVLIETRTRFNDASAPWTKLQVAKIIFHKPTKTWKVYWRRASGRWLIYSQHKNFDKALLEIERDKDCCFWG